ncbi:MAG: hypothetical protein NTX09_09885 [Verrucomicrobia bacterium]|nr:hypothetical protein [Verrucomicrobiota bacterium]
MPREGGICIIATLGVGGATIFWTVDQNNNSLGRDRLAFLAVTISFGVLFGLWQLLVLRSPAAKAWTEPTRTPTPAPHSS